MRKLEAKEPKKSERRKSSRKASSSSTVPYRRSRSRGERPKKERSSRWTPFSWKRVFRKAYTKQVTAVAAMAVLYSMKQNLGSSRLEVYLKDEVEPAADGNVPSHIMLCEELVSRTEKKGEKTVPVIVHEEGDVCESDSPFYALTRVFSSALIAQFGAELGLHYEHDCNANENSVLAVQQLLPRHIAFNSDVRIQWLVESCTHCITLFQNHLTFEDINECLLFPFSSSSTSQTSTSGSYIKLFHKAVFPDIATHLHNALSQLPAHYSPSPTRYAHEATPPKTALVYLSCPAEAIGSTCELQAAPLYLYAQQIPTFVSDIRILMSDSCSNNSPICKMYSQALNVFFKDFYPRSSITLDVFSSTAQTYREMTRADFLICPPSKSCLYPAIFTHNFAAILPSSTLYPWLSLVSPNIMPNLILLPTSIPLKSTLYNFNLFLQRQPDTTQELTSHHLNKGEYHQCTLLRGRAGSWVQDMEYARNAQYNLNIQGYAGTAENRFQPTKELFFRKPTTWKWRDKYYSDACPFELLNSENFCHIMNTLQIKRIFLLGDSLQFQMGQSLWKLLGYLQDFAEDRAAAVDHVIKCSLLSQTWSNKQTHDEVFELRFTFARNDRLLDVSEGPRNSTHKNCENGYCWPWVDKYLSISDKTLLVANTGAHYNKHSVFHDDFDTFTNLVDSFRRPDDIVVFRTSPPGHIGCETPDLEPFPTYDEYIPTITEKYSWDKFIDYNDYAAWRSERRRRRRITRGAPTNLSETLIHVLDVYPMTVLRPDGHAAGADCASCTHANDCLHYSLPGALDWWNHLLYNFLHDYVSADTDDS